MKKTDPKAPYGIIYALVSTRDEGNYRYVGKTVYPASYRLSGHRSEMKKGRKYHVYYWMR